MTKAELVDQVAATVQLPKHQIDTVITRFLQGIMDTLQGGDNVELRGFGSFRLRHRQAREGRNPRTGNPLQIPAKAIPSFTAGKAFQETCAVSSLRNVCEPDSTHMKAGFSAPTGKGT
jgi:DNA-binding protein HU-beta